MNRNKQVKKRQIFVAPIGIFCVTFFALIATLLVEDNLDILTSVGVGTAIMVFLRYYIK